MPIVFFYHQWCKSFFFSIFIVVAVVIISIHFIFVSLFVCTFL